jgi:hypothetical protein
MSGADKEQSRQRVQNHIDEVGKHIQEINRLHILLAGEKHTTCKQRAVLEDIFSELNGWQRTSFARAKSIMGCG